MTDYREQTRDFLNALLLADAPDLQLIMSGMMTHDCVFDISAPIGQLKGIDDILINFVWPLRSAFESVHRRDEIFIGGDNRIEDDGRWCASITHYAGNFESAFAGISPSHHLTFLRAGEFYRLDETGRISLARIIFDLPDLMRQAGRMPLPSLGLETMFPGPATHDGVFPSSPNLSDRSIDIVEAMLSDLTEYDPITFRSKGQTGANGYWHPNMFWYGPAGIGSNYTYPGFDRDHRIPFLKAFPDRKGGNHYCRIGDGAYAAVSGWPSMTMTHQGDYLGVPATGKPLTLRVMDFYRCCGEQIAENWVMLDYIDLFEQMGVDLIEKSEAMILKLTPPAEPAPATSLDEHELQTSDI